MAAYGVWRVLSAAPEEVSLDAAVAVVQEQESSRKDVENKPAHLDANQDVTSQPFSQDGVWRLDSETGTFSFEQSTGSFVGFRVKEELAKIGAVTAVGRTGQVDGELSIDEGKLQRVSVTADLSSLVTNDSR